MKNDYNIEEISFQIGKFAIQAMLYEIACFPSFGTVSPISKGAHADMDYYTFLDSTSALIPFMMYFSKQGLSDRNPKEIFCEIRKIGIEAEKEMYKATDGINTHKGMIFLMGISIAAASKVIYDKLPFKDIKDIIKKMTAGIVKSELQGLETNINKTNGEKLYEQYGVLGIRGQVERGIPIVFDFSLEFYKNNYELTKNHRLVHTLIGIMQFCEDTNIIHRKDLNTLKDVQNKSREIINLGGMHTREGIEAVNKLDKELVEKNISPGGSADILAVTVFMHLVEKYMEGRGIC